MTKKKAQNTSFSFFKTYPYGNDRYRRIHSQLESAPLKGPQGIVKPNQLSLGKHMDKPMVP
jgi:hypothetical protein